MLVLEGNAHRSVCRSDPHNPSTNCMSLRKVIGNNINTISICRYSSRDSTKQIAKDGDQLQKFAIRCGIIPVSQLFFVE